MGAPTKAAKKRTAAKAAPVVQPPADFDAEAELANISGMTGHNVINEDGSINPVQIGKLGRTPNPMVVLFTLDGKDYTVPSKPSPALMQRFFRDMRRKGTAVATADLLDTLLGTEALDALAESTEVGDEDMAAIYTALTKIAFGKLAKVTTGEGEASDPS